MITTHKQLAPCPPRRLAPAETLVFFALDSETPPIGDDVFDAVFDHIALMGCWKVLRVSAAFNAQPLRQNDAVMPCVMAEWHRWSALQPNPEALVLVRMTDFKTIPTLAFVFCVNEDEPKPNL